MKVKPFPKFPDYKIDSFPDSIFEICTTIRKKNNDGQWFSFNVLTHYKGDKDDAMKKFIMETYTALLFVNYDPKIIVAFVGDYSLYEIDPNQWSEKERFGLKQ